jgi:hypothetical protein
VSRWNAASVADPGAAMYAISRWSVSAMCRTWHSNSMGPVSGWSTRLTMGWRALTACSAHMAANRGDSESNSPVSAAIERSAGYLAYAARRSATTDRVKASACSSSQ